MRTFLAVAGLALVALPAATAADPDRVKFEQRKLEGTWEVIGAEANGANLKAKEVGDFKLTFKGNTFTAVVAGGKRSGTYTVDPTKLPRQIDITFTEGEGKGTTQYAIYSLTDDRLKIANGAPDRGRPTSFNTRAQSDLVVLTFRRVK